MSLFVPLTVFLIQLKSLLHGVMTELSACDAAYSLRDIIDERRIYFNMLIAVQNCLRAFLCITHYFTL